MTNASRLPVLACCLLLTAHRSPLNRAFLRGVDLGRLGLGLAEEVAAHVGEEELLPVGAGHVNAEVVDDLHLLLEPLAPADLTDFRGDALSQLVREGREAEGRAPLAAVFAFDLVSHDFCRTLLC